MKVRSKILQGINLFLNRVYIPRRIEQMNRPTVMHISDTPEEIYPYLYKLIKRVRPDYLIHTGDMVDNVKLEMAPMLESDYYRALEGFINSLESQEFKEIYYVSGNHDQRAKMESITEKGRVLEKGVITLEGCTFYVNHFFVKENPEAHYYLYGHSFEPKSHEKGKEVRLNGLEAIHLISLKEREVKKLPYPLGTNGFRKMERNYRTL